MGRGEGNGGHRGRVEYISRQFGHINNVLMCVVVLVCEYGMVSHSRTSSFCHHPRSDVIFWINTVCPVRSDFVSLPGIKWEEGFRDEASGDILLNRQGCDPHAEDLELVGGIHLVLDPFQGHQPFGNGMVQKGVNTMTKQAVGPGVDHVILDHREIDHPFAPIMLSR